MINELSDAFTDTKRVNKSHIQALNAPTRIDITLAEVTIQKNVEDQSVPKTKNPRKRKEQNNTVRVTPIEIIDKIPEEIVSKISEEIGSRTP
jgi:hypothetical protein